MIPTIPQLSKHMESLTVSENDPIGVHTRTWRTHTEYPNTKPEVGLYDGARGRAQEYSPLIVRGR